MKSVLLPALMCVSSLVFAETATFAGQAISAAGANWYYEGYKVTAAGKYECSSKGNFSYTPQDGYKEVKVSKLTQENATKIEKTCTFSNGEDTGKICLITAEYKHSQETKGEFDLTKVITVQEKTGKVPCQN
ncbi:MAG: hypothetical protein K2Y14_02845 [Burkholderiales bacterium]|nr:hypothetical protein [Burkholderiales bacterium]